MSWVDVMGVEELRARGRAVVRRAGRQVLLLATERGVYACASRCPHEGYPLSEGVVSDGCVLTCNWHNWKFDLESGETLVGGDLLRRFPVRVEDGRVWVELAAEDEGARRARILAAIPTALDEEDADRLVREAARLMRLDGDPADAVAVAVAWATPRLEYGMTHAFAGAVDWLALFDQPGRAEDERLAALGEILAHVADDVGGGGLHPYPPGEAAWDASAFLAAVEAEDEAGALSRVRGALAAGMSPRALQPVFLEAALSHYADFGHALIYSVKAFDLIDRLGAGSAEPVLSLLVRTLVYVRREDLIPEFRAYGPSLAAWGTGEAVPLSAEALRGGSARQAMAVVAGWGGRHDPAAIWAVLVEASAWTLLHVDEGALSTTSGKIADNVSWLAFTHLITFAEAGRTVLARRPDLAPALLLQMACFLGRSSPYLDAGQDVAGFHVADAAAFEAAAIARLFDHGQHHFILSVHMLKTLRAGLALGRDLPAVAPLIHAGLNRYLAARVKLRHVLRTARQMRDLAAEEV